MAQINVIREKAAEAEAIVKTITGDIQRLDTAKRNMTGAMQTLERWTMLSGYHWLSRKKYMAEYEAETVHGQLRELLPTQRYKELSETLSVSEDCLSC